MGNINKKQLKANRENAKRSKGPTTEEGKSVVRGNAMKHGLLAKAVVVNTHGFGETQEEFDSVLFEFFIDRAPEGMQEEMLVEKIVVTLWRLRRAFRIEAAFISRACNNELESLDGTPYPTPTTGLVEGATPLMFSYVRNLRGINTILAILKSAENETTEKGVVSESTQKYLYQVFGKSDNSVARKIFMNCFYISEGKRLRDEDHENDAKIPGADVCKIAIAEEIKEAYDHYHSMVASMEKYEMEKNRVDRLVQCAPTDPEAQALQRQIIHLERQFHKDMDQLERLQRRRLGDAVPPPISLNLTADIHPGVQLD